MIYQSISELVGRTPLVELKKTQEELGLKARVLVKLEYFNPAGSVKDRIALNILREAQNAGLLKEGTVIIEPTSGNTGIGICALGAYLGYEVKIVMPETMSVERQKLIKFFGADLILTPGSEGMPGAIKKAEELAAQEESAFIPSQFENPANPQAHYRTTGPEIWADTDGHVDVFISGVGTGGTLSGTGSYLKEKNPNLEVIGLEPASSPVLTEGKSGSHKIQGIGAGFVPDTLDEEVYDRILTVTNEDAIKAAQDLARLEGFLVGISSGAALSAALDLAKKDEYAGKTLVAILPDTGERYLSTDLFA